MVCGWGDMVTGEHEDALCSQDGVGGQRASGRWSLGRKAGPRPALRGVCGA